MTQILKPSKHVSCKFLILNHFRKLILLVAKSGANAVPLVASGMAKIGTPAIFRVLVSAIHINNIYSQFFLNNIFTL